MMATEIGAKANALWDVLPDLGLADSRGGAEYRRIMSSPTRAVEFAQATDDLRRALQHFPLEAK